MYALPCVMLVIGSNFTSKSATKDTLIVLKGNRAEGEENRGRGEASHPTAYVAVRRKLINNLLANLRSRFPQVELLNAMKVRLVILFFHVMHCA